jgi:hypothetical protein
MEGKSDEKTGFVVDEMLWKLGRFLRIAGFDTQIPRPTSDDELARISKEENRILLTRDKDLSRRKDVHALRISHDSLENQLKELVEGLDLKSFSRSGSRCPVCGHQLEVRKKDDLDDSIVFAIPAGVLSYQDVFYICTKCQRAYWRGNHWEGITSILKRVDLVPDI